MYLTHGDIFTIEDLEDINLDLAQSYRLMNDLDFKDRKSYRTQEKYEYYNIDEDEDGNPDNSWMPIGATSQYFTGGLNGQYYKIKHLYYSGPSNFRTY